MQVSFARGRNSEPATPAGNSQENQGFGRFTLRLPAPADPRGVEAAWLGPSGLEACQSPENFVTRFKFSVAITRMARPWLDSILSDSHQIWSVRLHLKTLSAPEGAVRRTATPQPVMEMT
jgi:hypothetical protein